jgi:hypothetical protein
MHHKNVRERCSEVCPVCVARFREIHFFTARTKCL